MKWQCENARQIVIRILGLGEIACDMVLVVLDLA